MNNVLIKRDKGIADDDGPLYDEELDEEDVNDEGETEEEEDDANSEGSVSP